MSRRIKSDHIANGPNGLSWSKPGAVVTVDDDAVANDLLRHAGFTEVGGNAPTADASNPTVAAQPDADGNCPTCGQLWSGRDSANPPPEQIGEGRDVTIPGGAVPLALGGPSRPAVTPQPTDAQEQVDRKTGGGTKPASKR